MAGPKADGAFRTIGELAAELGIAQHILRYWETKFPLKPLQRAGNRRYYRPADVALARRINELLNKDGYTVRGVQKLLREGRLEGGSEAAPAELLEEEQGSAVGTAELRRLRDRLSAALDR